MSPFEYTPRAPSASVVYAVVREHVESFLADATRARDGYGLPRFVEDVGVVRDSRFANLRDGVRMSYYIPLAQSGPLDRFTSYVRHRAADAAIAPAARQAVARVDRRLRVYEFRTTESQIAESMYIERLVSSLSARCGVLALGLAAVGLYG